MNICGKQRLFGDFGSKFQGHQIVAEILNNCVNMSLMFISTCDKIIKCDKCVRFPCKVLWTYIDSDRCRVFVFDGTVVLKCLQKEITSTKNDVK